MMPPRKVGSASSVNAADMSSSCDEEANFGDRVLLVDHASGKPSNKRSYYNDLQAEARGEVSNSRKRLVLAVVCAFAVIWIVLLGLVRVLGWASDSEIPATFQSNGRSSYYYQHWCNNSDLHGGAMELLDDRFCRKKFPRDFNRDLTCEGFLTQPQDMPSGYTDVTALRDLSQLNVTLLDRAEVTVPGLSIAVIVIRRTPDGRTFFKQYGNSLSSTPVETWSSSKIFIAAAAGIRLHGEADCADFGLHSYVGSVVHKEVPLGDLATVIASYDTTAGYSSNSLAYYFRGVSQAKRIQQVLDAVLPNSSNTLEGYYGEPMPKDLGVDTSTFSGENEGAVISGVALPDTCTLNLDHTTPVGNNSLSSIAAAQLLMRLVLHREMPLAARFPLLQWSDIQELLYGAGERSRLFPGQLWGGMSADTAIFIQDALSSLLSVDNIDAASDGQWRIFSKLGYGFSHTRNVIEMLNTGYVCLPSIAAMNSNGAEFFLSVRAQAAGNVDPCLPCQSDIRKAVRAVVEDIFRGIIQ